MSKKPMSEKSEGMKASIEQLFPGTMEAIESNCCPMCRNPIGEFRDDLSIREYEISGMCQECQDIAFGGPEWG